VRLYKQPTETQVEKIRKNWARISRFGFVRFVLLVGTAMFVFMIACWVGFIFLYGNQRVLHMAFVWEATLPGTALLSYLFPVLYYGMVWTWIRRVDAATRAF
jgi:hypothetical protein